VAEIPPVYPFAEKRCPEKIEVASAEDEDVEDLGDQGDSLSAAVPMNRPHEDEF